MAVGSSIKIALLTINLSAWMHGLVTLSEVLMVVPKDVNRLRESIRKLAEEAAGQPDILLSVAQIGFSRFLNCMLPQRMSPAWRRMYR